MTAKLPPFTIQPRLVCNNGRSTLGEFRIMRATVAIIGLLALGGCAADSHDPEQPTMYLSMANGGATLDPQAAASMISLYRQNNGLGAVVVDPDLMKLAEAAVAGDGQPQQARPRRQGRRWRSG